MKKVVCMLCAVSLALCAFAGCADSKKNNSSSKADTKAESEAKAEKTYAQRYNDLLLTRDFSVTFTDESELMPSSTVTVKYSGDDFSVSSVSETASYEMYLVDNKMYYFDLTNDNKNYSVTDYDAEISGDFSPIDACYGIEDDYKLESSETEGGLICETYSFADEVAALYEESSDSGTRELVRYYFNEESGELVKIEREYYGTQLTINVDEISNKGGEITLPDLTEWVNESDHAENDYEEEYFVE